MHILSIKKSISYEKIELLPELDFTKLNLKEL